MPLYHSIYHLFPFLQLIIFRNMGQNFYPITAILLLLLHCGTALEWYEQGHQNLLTWENFDAAIEEKGTYKFVKFFTRNCRYCRLLKQVEQELQKEKDWGFKFYSVDCSLHYDLCSAKATISAYPYVGIYNTNGVLSGKIGGFYPLETMREAFKTVEEWQKAELEGKNAEPQVQTQVEAHHEQPELKTVTVENSVKSPEAKVEAEVKTEEKVKKTKTDDEDDSDWKTSIKDGIRMTIMLLGVILFNKIIFPYLQKDKQPEDVCKPRRIELPLHPNQPTSSVKPTQINDSETNRLLSDTL